MTDREKYRTRSGYFCLSNTDQARQELEALVSEFPADSTALSNLAVTSSFSQGYGACFRTRTQGVSDYPNNVLRRNNVALFALYSGDFVTAEKEAAAWTCC